MYKAAIIGFGNIGYFLSKDKKRKNVWSHFEAYKKIKNVQLVAIVEINNKKRIQIKKKFSNIHVYKTFEELISSKNKIDIFSICTPTKTHFELLKKIIKVKPKIIFCEKPLCEKILDAKKILILAKKFNSRIIINHQRRFEDNFVKAREIIKKNTIGDISNINSYYTDKIYNIGTHLIDCIRMIIGVEPLSTFAFYSSSKRKIDPSISGIINFKNKILCSIQSLGKKYSYVFEIDIIGSKGRLSITDNGKKIKLYKFVKSKNFTKYKELKIINSLKLFKGTKKIRFDPMKELFKKGIESFEKNKNISPNIFDGYQNLLIANSMVRSAKLKRFIKI